MTITGATMIEGARYVSTTPMSVAPVTLEGEKVKLVPMDRSHADAIAEAARFPEIWAWTTAANMDSPAGVAGYIDFALSEQAAGRAIPFVTMDQATGEIIGSTRFGNINEQDHRLEIGWTWIRPDRQRSGANSEAKCLMLQQAFDAWTGLRVELKTDSHNARSRRAIERLGARYEGVFRQHMVMTDGRIRDSAYYSILDVEWRDPNHPIHKLALSHGIIPSPTTPL